MPDSIADLLPALVAFRRDIHAHPELGFQEHRTASLVAAALKELGLEVREGIGGTGVVGILRAGSSDRTIGLRADMDALPINEETGLPHASTQAGIFHGCGHDGHTTMLLGAARHLARTRRFDGAIRFIFQPAEEGLGGAREMVKDGLFTRFPCQRVFALHNWPDLPAHHVATRPGPIMAAADKFEIVVKGKGGHAAMPHVTPDAILAASEMVGQLNTIIARRIPPMATAVLSVTRIQGGHAHNVIPAAVTLGGTVRSFDPAIQDRIEAALRQIVEGVALAHGVTADIAYDRYYPATINDAEAAAEALSIAAKVAPHAFTAPDPAFTSEDFAFMLQATKGAYLWLGQGANHGHSACGTSPLHHPHYDFNDEIIPTGIRLHAGLVEGLLAPNVP